ncbi:MAG: hypothetical protein FWC17_06005 [Treponema sp.]|nr:hypothetical protein [Treponema sp.]
MNLDKLQERIESAGVVEELLMLSEKVFGKNSDDVKKVVKIFITKSYLMGKKNLVHVVEE